MEFVWYAALLFVAAGLFTLTAFVWGSEKAAALGWRLVQLTVLVLALALVIVQPISAPVTIAAAIVVLVFANKRINGKQLHQNRASDANKQAL